MIFRLIRFIYLFQFLKCHTGIRCGDANAAKAVLDGTPLGQENFPEQPVLYSVLSELSRQQGHLSCLFEAGSPVVADHDRNLLINFFQKATNLEPNATDKIRVLALLGGQPIPPSSTVEDYLFGHLWLALQDREDPLGKIIELGTTIRKYGPASFSQEEDGGWGYVLPLLASQQFRTALSYLAQAGGAMGVLQAVHLGLAFSIAKVEVADLVQQQGRPTSMPMLGSGIDNESCSLRSSSLRANGLVSALLVKYTHLLEQDPSAGAHASLQYLLLIRDKDMLRQEVAALVIRAQHLEGELDAIGERNNCELDKYLPKEEVSNILGYAAELCKKQASDQSRADKSAVLFMLGHRYTSLIQLLNEFMSPPNDFSDEKMKWCSQSQLFFDDYLEKRTLVLESLEREGKINLKFSLESMIRLRSFFDALRHKNYDSALSIVLQLGLLPFTKEELDEKANKYKDFDPSLKDAFPATVVGTVQCFYEIHRRLKSESRGVSATEKERLKE